MSAKDQIKRIVDAFKREPQLKDKTDGMAEGLLLGAQLADEANELSKDVQAQVDQLVVEGDSSVEAAQARVDASGKSYTTLKKRLDEKEQETTAQFQQTNLELSKKASINYLDAILMDIAKGGPKGPFMSITELENADYSEGKEGTWLVFDSSFSDGAHSFMWDSTNSAWKDLGVYQATGIAKKSVGIEETNFITKSTNLHDKKTELDGYAILSTTGDLVDNNDYATSRFYEVKALEYYSTKTFNRVAYYDDDKLITAGIKELKIAGDYFQIPFNAIKMRLHRNKEAGEKPQLNKGRDLLPYEPYFIKMDSEIETVADKTITEIKLSPDLYSKSTNLHDTRNEVKGFSIDSTTGELTINKEYISSQFYEVEGLESISTKAFNRVHFYTSKKQLPLGLKILDPTGDSFQIPLSATRIRFHRRYDVVENPQINKGSVLLPYEPYYVKLDNFKIGQDLLNKEKPYTFVPDEIGHNFILKDGTYIKHETVTEFNDSFNSLVIANPTYLKRTSCGKDTTGKFDIFKYSLKPEEYDGSKVSYYGGSDRLKGKLPKISIIGNIHGHEQSSALALYYMIKALCDDWKTNDALEYLRHNVEFEIIPLAYPNGYETDEYKNTSGVNLQTNFPYNHVVIDPDSPIYGGAAPLTELETIYCKQFIDDNKDSMIFFDLHGNEGNTEIVDGLNSVFYYLMSRLDGYNEDVEFSAKYGIESISRLLKKNYPIETNNLLGWCQMRDGNGTADAYASSLGIPSFVLEVPQRTLYNQTEKHSSDSIKMATEILINNILVFLRHYKEI